MEENLLANEIIENVATYLQYVAHPKFLLTDVSFYIFHLYVQFYMVFIQYDTVSLSHPPP